MSVNLQRKRIVEVTLLDRMPEDKFIRTNGGSTEDYDIGHFKGKEDRKMYAVS